MSRKDYWRLVIKAPLFAIFGLLIIVPVLSLPSQGGDREDMEATPRSCRQLHAWQEKCRLDPDKRACNVKQIEAWRERCKRDSAKK